MHPTKAPGVLFRGGTNLNNFIKYLRHNFVNSCLELFRIDIYLIVQENVDFLVLINYSP